MGYQLGKSVRFDLDMQLFKLKSFKLRLLVFVKLFEIIIHLGDVLSQLLTINASGRLHTIL